MSKHFELMQQMEKEQLFDSKPAATPIFSSESSKYGSAAHKRWADEEALSLVQQIFLLQTKEPPRVVVFAGIDHGTGCSQVCVSVAEDARQELCQTGLSGRSQFSFAGSFGNVRYREPSRSDRGLAAGRAY